MPGKGRACAAGGAACRSSAPQDPAGQDQPAVSSRADPWPKPAKMKLAAVWCPNVQGTIQWLISANAWEKVICLRWERCWKSWVCRPHPSLIRKRPAPHCATPQALAPLRVCLPGRRPPEARIAPVMSAVFDRVPMASNRLHELAAALKQVKAIHWPSSSATYRIVCPASRAL